MTARFLALIVLFAAACARKPAPPEAKTVDLAVPPMPAASTTAEPGARSARTPKPMSYDEALARWSEEGVARLAEPETDLTDGELSQPMRNATFVSGCGAPDSMKLTVKVAVRGGRAVGVTVRTNPPSEGVAGCVDAHVRRDLRWPERQKMHSFTVTY